jgi:hypothetical protein
MGFDPATGNVGCRLYPISSLAPLWQPISDFNPRTHDTLTSIPFVPLDFVGNTLRRHSRHEIEISVMESPLHDEVYDLVVKLADITPTSNSQLLNPQRVSRYHLLLPGRNNTSPPTPRLILKDAILPGCINCGARWGISWAWVPNSRSIEIKVHRLHGPGIGATQHSITKEDNVDYDAEVQLSSTGIITVWTRSEVVLYYSV